MFNIAEDYAIARHSYADRILVISSKPVSLLYETPVQENTIMVRDTFFICPNCGNNKEFRIFASAFRDIRQSPELGIRREESDALPNLRQTDTYIECKLCFQKFEYDRASAVGKKYIKTTQRLRKTKYTSLRLDAPHVDGK